MFLWHKYDYIYVRSRSYVQYMYLYFSDECQDLLYKILFSYFLLIRIVLISLSWIEMEWKWNSDRSDFDLNACNKRDDAPTAIAETLR